MPISFLKSGDRKNILDAIDRSQAVIEFSLDGTILSANENFCRALGYSAKEIVGKHHRIFVDPREANSPEYADFWKSLASGKFDRRQYKRFTKSGEAIWIEASYNPVMRGGKPYKVIKFATDISATKRRELDSNGKLEALSRVQAIIEFTPDGKILTANDNFLNTLGYKLEEIVGKHHSIFCDPSYSGTADYVDFWKSLSSGKFFSDEFKRIGKGGNAVHIQATYNPILDDTGAVMKVVKFATNVTGRVTAIDELGSGLGRLADCNIRMTIDKPFTPEFEHLRDDFNMAIGKFQETLVEVLRETSELSSKSTEMKESANNLAHRSEQQAASLEETSAALEELTHPVTESTTRTTDTRSLVQETRTAASESVEVVKATVSAMGRIEGASSEIGNIISVIDEIAFQTNLLALNAGVEAARAGESGKGFAVVAQEVRELAQRSATAAKEISELIAKSTVEVKEGVRLVGETGTALHRIESFVESINGNVEAIATTAAKQATSLTEINSAVNLLDQMTQQNSSMVSSVSSVSDALARGADRLEELVSRFQLNRRAAIREPGSAASRLGAENRNRSAATTSGASESANPGRGALRAVSQPRAISNGNTALKDDAWEEF